MMKAFVWSFYGTIFLTLFAIGSIPPKELLQIWTEGTAETVTVLCRMLTVEWIILTGLVIFLFSSCVDIISDIFSSTGDILRNAFQKWKTRRALKHLVVLGLVLTLTALSACASNADREIQHDPSGTDLPLKSPCACTQVPYSAPSYLWVG